MLPGTIGLEIRGDLCHGRDPLGGQPIGFKSPRRRSDTSKGMSGPGALPAEGEEGRLLLLIIYKDSNNSLGGNNPNKLSKDVLDLIPGLEATQ